MPSIGGTGEPFGLPNGTVRGTLALAFTMVTLYLFATNQPVPVELLSVNMLIVGNYFGIRGGEPPTPVREEPLALPDLGEVE